MQQHHIEVHRVKVSKASGMLAVGQMMTTLFFTQVGGIKWFCKEQRGVQALQAPEWHLPEKYVLALHNLEVRGDEKWLPVKFAALQELSLRGRPRSFMVPASCQTLSLAYQVSSQSTAHASFAESCHFMLHTLFYEFV